MIHCGPVASRRVVGDGLVGSLDVNRIDMAGRNMEVYQVNIGCAVEDPIKHPIPASTQCRPTCNFCSMSQD